MSTAKARRDAKRRDRRPRSPEQLQDTLVRAPTCDTFWSSTIGILGFGGIGGGPCWPCIPCIPCIPCCPPRMPMPPPMPPRIPIPPPIIPIPPIPIPPTPAATHAQSAKNEEKNGAPPKLHTPATAAARRRPQANRRKKRNGKAWRTHPHPHHAHHGAPPRRGAVFSSAILVRSRVWWPGYHFHAARRAVTSLLLAHEGANSSRTVCPPPGARALAPPGCRAEMREGGRCLCAACKCLAHFFFK